MIFKLMGTIFIFVLGWVTAVAMVSRLLMRKCRTYSVDGMIHTRHIVGVRSAVSIEADKFRREVEADPSWN